MGKIKKKHLLKRIEELEKSVKLLMDIQSSNMLREMRRLEILSNVASSVDENGKH